MYAAMGIQIYCPACRSAFALGAKVCPKCAANLARNRKYRVAVSHAGRVKVKIVDGSLELARQVESKLKNDAVQTGVLGVTKAPTLGEAWDKFLAWAKINKRSWRDDQYRWDMHIAPRLSGLRMNEIQPKDIQSVLDGMALAGAAQGKPYAAATIRQVFVLIKRVFNWSYQQGGYDGANPSERIDPPCVDNRVTECLSQEEIGRLVAVCDAWPNRTAALVVKFALFTGLRQGEILHLRWQDIDFKNEMLTIQAEMAKGKKSNTLRLSRAALDVLNEVQSLRIDSGWVFANGAGEERKQFGKIWERIRAKANLPEGFRFHGLRHTFASYVASSGKVDLYTLQNLLTHKSPQMTQRYAHLLDEAMKRATGVVDDIFGNNK